MTAKNAVEEGVTLSNCLRVCKLAVLILIWGVFGVIYNIYSKEALQKLPLPIFLGLLQLSTGTTFVVITWIASAPAKEARNLNKVIPIAICHAVGSLGTLISMNFSSVGFTHIVKSGEPIATAVLSYCLTSKQYSIVTYSTLLLIVFGIGLASANELNFSLAGFLSSGVAAVFYPLRIVLSKKMVSNPDAALCAKSLFRVVTILSTALAVPLCVFDIFFGETQEKISLLTVLTNDRRLLFLILSSGASFHIYTEVSVSPLIEACKITIFFF